MKLLKQIALTFRLIKFERFLGSLFYSFQRDRLERQYSPPQTPTSVQSPGRLIQAEARERGADCQFERAELEITFLTPELVRLEWKPGKPPLPYAIAKQDWPDVENHLEPTAEGWKLTSASLNIEILNDGHLKFLTPNGELLREELPPQQLGEMQIHQARLRPEECIYGLGERAASLDLRRPKTEGQNIPAYRMWNYDAGGVYTSGTDPLYLCIPVYLGLHHQGSYLVFYENPYPANFSFEATATASFEGGSLCYYFTSGTPNQLLERYTELTGKPPLPPRWAFGYHQSRWGYGTQAAVQETVESFIQRDLPISAIHLDIDCQDNFRAFTVDPDTFPDIKTLTANLAARSIQLITILNPGIKATRKSKLFQEGRTQGFFCNDPQGNLIVGPVWPGMSAFPDFSNPDVRHWWTRQYEYLLDLGIRGFWHDMNEPGIFALWGDPSLPPHATQHNMEGRGGNHQEAHNLYGMLQAIAAYDALREYLPEIRPFVISRAGWAGLQRYAWTWTGDVQTSWEGLRQTVPTVLGMGLSGIPYTGPDIGGFKGNPSPELYLRWFQMAAFLPFCRTHSANNVKHRTPWMYGEPYLSLIRELLRLRYRLLPFFYTLAWEMTQTGHPMVRPLFWLDPTDVRLWSVDDAFLVGDALLVCPILAEGVRSRQVILPKGEWYPFWDDTPVSDSETLTLDAPLETIPLLVKAGTILAMEENQQLILHLYPCTEGNCMGQVYSDAGDGYGEWRVDRFQLHRTGAEITLIWQSEGNFEFPYHRVKLQFHGIQPQQVWIKGQDLPIVETSIECDSCKVLISKTM
ncbi:MAG: glycoside hydrolase family 31 protein [Desertifilum sp. SIO1I2]|nr:glycoside hydrolase family 31 protein [Desertifilum sp. SIO1I2]